MRTRLIIKRLLPVPIVLILVLSMFRSHKPAEPGSLSSQRDGEPEVFQTSLGDSMPAASMFALHLLHVEGVKVAYSNGDYASYFEYIADPDAVLREVSHTPFPRYAVVADTLCRKVDNMTLDVERKKLSATESETFAAFWNTDMNEYEAYQCIKGQVTHTLLISRHTKNILHRVAYTMAS